MSRYSVDFVKSIEIKDSWLTVIDEVQPEMVHGSKRRMISLKCKCGELLIKSILLYMAGRIKSCRNCSSQRRSFFTRKYTDTQKALLRVYNAIKARCYSKTSGGYYLYGGRGVKMCDEWLNDFNSFYEWAISNGWKKGLEVDKDILGRGTLLYSPETCKIVTRKENANNRRDNKKYPYMGGLFTRYELSEKFGVHHNTIDYRYNVIGLSMEEIEIIGKKKLSNKKKHE